MTKLLTIVGPTATGKTAFAWEIAAQLWQKYQLHCDLISADSRQVYQGLEVTSGVDLPQNAVREDDHFLVGKHRLWGVNILKPTDEWSVAHFNQLVNRVTQVSWSENRLPIIVGGTGLYSEMAMNADPQLVIAPNDEIRNQAELLTLAELQAWVQRVAAPRWALLNESDRANPRRLVRAIEIALHQETKPTVKIVKNEASELVIGLTLPIEKIEQKITTRVQERWQHGALTEISQLQMLATEYPRLPALSSTGVKQVMAYLNDQASMEEAQHAWMIAERQYAKRQLTWWKKRTQVEWFAVDQEQWLEDAKKKIELWCQSS